MFIGLKNYIEIFTSDPNFGQVTYNTLYYVGLSAPLGVASAFLMATLLNTEMRGRSIFRAIFFPAIVPVVVAMVWQFLVNIQYGAINATLQSLGLPVIPFIANPAFAKPTIILIHMWAQGNAMVIFLATLQDVPLALRGGDRRWGQRLAQVLERDDPHVYARHPLQPGDGLDLRLPKLYAALLLTAHRAEPGD